MKTNVTSPSPRVRTVILEPDVGFTSSGQTPPKTKKNKRQSKAVVVGGQRYSKTGFLPATAMVNMRDSSSMVIERTELLEQVNASSTANAYTATTIAWFPGSSRLSWLRNFSNSYSQYEVHRLEFTYVPNVPTTTPGVVAMCFFADIRDTTPTSLPQILASEQSLYAPVYAGGDGGTFLQRFGSPGGNVVSFEVPNHAIKYDNGTHKMFKITNQDGYEALTLGGGLAVGNLYSPGEVTYATSGCPAGANVGAIFVRYRVVLKGPIPITSQA